MITFGGLRDRAGWRGLRRDHEVPDGGGLTAAGRARREGARLEAAQLFEQDAGGWDVARSLFGTVRQRVTAANGTPGFAGIALAGAGRYLSGPAYATVTGTTNAHPSYRAPGDL